MTQDVLTLRIEGMDCADCALKLERGIGQLPGVQSCDVSFATTKLHLVYDPTVLSPGDVQRRTRAMGYRAVSDSQSAKPGRQARGGPIGLLRRKPREALTAVAGTLILLAFVSQLLNLPALLVNALYLLAIITGGYHVALRGLSSLRYSRELDINGLMTVAVVGACLIGAWPEGALVVFLFSLGESLEGYTMDRARQAIRSLMALAPQEATVLRPCLDCTGHLGQVLPDGSTYSSGPCPWCDAHEIQVPVEELSLGEHVLVRPGQRVPIDGVVVGGRSGVNQAPITGESLPVEKAPGDEVYAGTVNGSGALQIEVTRQAQDTTLSRIIHMVEEAQTRRAPVQRWVDRFARVYTPAVVGVAVLVAIVPPLLLGQPWLNTQEETGWVYRALALLVIACPCALVISTPVSIVSAISAAARHGVLIKGGAYLEAISQVEVIAFDKTGTLTVGSPGLTLVVCCDHLGLQGEPSCQACEDVLALATAVERRSEHPLAAAVLQAAEAQQLHLRYPAADAVVAVAGQGVQGMVNGKLVSVSSHRHVHSLDICTGDGACLGLTGLEAAGHTVMVVHDEQRIQGFLAAADQIRPAAARTVAALKAMGIKRLVMLTGDNEATAHAVAHQAGMDEVRAHLMPADKVAAVKELTDRYRHVAMIGDGVNDAPAMAQATVGIAMGGAGSDQALETADVVLMGDDLELLPYLIGLGRSAQAIIVQNVAFSLLVKVIFMVLAFQGQATLWMAVFADVGASLIVILNSMRLLRRRPQAAEPISIG